MSASEAAQALSISRNTYYRRVKDGTINPFRVGLGRMRVKRSDVDKLLKP
jgi:excisionase family DNA binding protein